MSRMHLDEEQLQRAIHGELRPDADSAVREHLGACQQCRARLEEAEREEDWVLERLTTLDHPSPRISVKDVVHREPRRTRSRSRLAAGLILALGAAGAAYAVPGSPLPAALDRLAQLIAPGRAAPTPAPTTGSEFQAGIAVDPGARLTITFMSGGSADTAFISLIEESQVSIRASGGSASFDSQAGRLIVRHTSPANFEIRIPRWAPWVELSAGGRRLFFKAGDRVTAQGGIERSGHYAVPLSGVVR